MTTKSQGDLHDCPTLTPEALLQSVLKTPPRKWTYEDEILKVLATFRHDGVEWAKIEVAWTEGTRTAPTTLKKAVSDWMKKHGWDNYSKKPPKTSAPKVDDIPHGDWEKSLIHDREGDPKQAFNNMCLFLEYASPWREDLWYDEVRGVAMLDGKPLDDNLIHTIARWLGDTARMTVSNLKMVGHACVAVCFPHPRDLLQEWINTLPEWDGKARLETWLQDCAGTPDTAYGKDVSRLIPVSMIARALDPGCRYRFVVMLEGEEETGKSSLVRALATDEWLYECSESFEGKEARILMQGHWVAEMPEIQSMSRTEENRFKGFITNVVDTWVPKYANFHIKKPRRTIFIGTLNPEATKEYLRGQTGNTRYLPIPTGIIQPQLLTECREQLFAEAKVYYDSHLLTWWQLSAEGSVIATTLREERRVSGAFEGPKLEAWLSTVLERSKPHEDSSGKADPQKFLTTVPFHVTEALEECFNIPSERWNKSIEDQVGKAIGNVKGWYSKNSRAKGGQHKLWFYEAMTSEETPEC